MWKARIEAALLAIAIVSPMHAFASSEVADAVMHADVGRLQALIAEAADVDAAQVGGATALHWAAHHEDLEATAVLLDAGADPDIADGQGMTPLLLAAITGNVELVRRLLDAGAEIDGRMRNGETPLMMAARTGNAAVIELLLARGAEIEAAESLRGTTALMWAAAYANPEAVSTLVEQGADVHARSDTTSPGREPYLAPPARERIREFVEGTGLRGAVVDFDSDEDGQADREDTSEEGTSEEGTSEEGTSEEGTGSSEESRVETQIAAARSALGDQDVPEPGQPEDEKDHGGLTPLIFATREGDRASAEVLVEAGADVNQTSAYGWTPLLTATHNRYYELGAYLLEHGADPNIANEGGWTPLYIAADNRNIEAGDYPTRRPDMDHLEYIELLLGAGADPNLRMKTSTETRTVFTQQWLYEDGATPFLRAAQSGDVTLMKLLLEHGADPGIPTLHGVTPLMVASGIGWVEGVTYEWSPEQTREAVELLLELGADVNVHDDLDGRTALMGAAHKGRPDIVQLLVDHGADLDARDIGSRDSIHSLAGITWRAIDYAEGLVRVGVQSATPNPETAALIRRLMRERGLSVPPEERSLESICLTEVCK